MAKNRIFGIKQCLPEFLFSLSMSLYSLLSGLTTKSGNSTIILLVSVLVCFTIQTIYNYKHDKSGIPLSYIILLLGITSLLSLDIIFRYNENTLSYFYSFLVYAVIPLYFLSNVKNYAAVLFYYSIIASIVAILYFRDPIIGYKISGDYMQFGFSVMLPAFTGLCILSFYFKKRILILAVLIIFIYSFIFCNKGVIITQLIILVFYIVYDSNRFKFKRLLLVVATLWLLLLLAEPILEYGFHILNFFGGESSYSLNTILKIINGDGDSIFNVRLSIWNDAITLILQKPWFGWGVGWFEKIYPSQPYPHNFILQIFVEYGIVGFSIFFIFFLLSIYVTFKVVKSNEKKVFLITMLLTWIVPLCISLSYWNVSSFWVYILVTMSCFKRNLFIEND